MAVVAARIESPWAYVQKSKPTCEERGDAHAVMAGWRVWQVSAVYGDWFVAFATGVQGKHHAYTVEEGGKTG